MYDLIRDLSPARRVLDLGAGLGSFDYSATSAHVVALDLKVEPQQRSRADWVAASANRLPFRNSAFDVVICNHSLEHFESLPGVLAEVGRVLEMGGYLWASVPSDGSLDDRLYRFLYRGGGHVNRFTLEQFLDSVEAAAGVRAVRLKKLYSGFVYLNPPPSRGAKSYPRRLKLLEYPPPPLRRALIRRFNQTVRIADRFLNTDWSGYGWAVCFERTESVSKGDRRLEILSEDVNVCFSCGAGHPLDSLKDRWRLSLLSRTYTCPSCGERNFYFGR